MEWDLTSQLFSYMDEVTKTFVATNLTKIIAIITPLVAIALNMSIMVNGLYGMVGSGPPLLEEMKKFIRYAIIISVASAGGWYQKSLADVAITLPDEFSQALVLPGSGTADSTQIAKNVDLAIDKSLQLVKKAWDNIGFSGPGVAAAVLGLILLIATIFIFGVGTALLLMAKFLMGVVVCFGPIFIFCLLFNATQNLFNKWISSVINYGLVTIFMAVVFGLFIAFMSRAVQAGMEDNASLMIPTVTASFITVIAYFVFKEVPQMAARWGDGIEAAYQGFKMPDKGKGGDGNGNNNNNSGGGQQQGSSGAQGGQQPGVGAGSAGGTGGGAGSAVSDGLRYARGGR